MLGKGGDEAVVAFPLRREEGRKGGREGENEMRMKSQQAKRVCSDTYFHVLLFPLPPSLPLPPH